MARRGIDSTQHLLNVNNYNQYLNCRGDASPHQELASPHRDLDVYSSRFERWMMKRSRASTNKSYQFRPNTVPNYGEDILFGLRLISGKKRFNFRRIPFFLVFIQLRGRNYIILAEVWSRLQKRSSMQNFTI